MGAEKNGRAQWGTSLKKQSQFGIARINVNVVLGKDYKNIPRFWGEKTKPILRKGKSKKVKGKNESKSDVSLEGDLKKQNQSRALPGNSKH